MSKNTAIIIVVSAFLPFAELWGRGDILRESIDTLSSPAMEGRGRINSSAQGELLPNKGHDAAAEYIASCYSSFGLSPIEADFQTTFHMADGHGDGINVIGLFPGLKNFAVNGYIVVGAHYDHLGTIKGKIYPGADSNASGVAALLYVAEHFQRLQSLNRYFNCSIVFVAFDCYLDGASGAKWLLDKIKSGRLVDPVTGSVIREDKVRLMVDLDQVGSTLAPLHEAEDYLIALGVESLPRYKSRILEKVNSEIGLDLGMSYYGSKNFTKTFYRLGDRGVFVKEGIPTLYFTSGITDLTNSMDDTADKINFITLRRRVDFICRVLEEYL